MTQFLSVRGRVFLAMPVLHQLFAKVARHRALHARREETVIHVTGPELRGLQRRSLDGLCLSPRDRLRQRERRDSERAKRGKWICIS
jgi:hypothetical protein